MSRDSDSDIIIASLNWVRPYSYINNSTKFGEISDAKYSPYIVFTSKYCQTDRQADTMITIPLALPRGKNDHK